MPNKSTSVEVLIAPDPRSLETEDAGGEAVEAVDTPRVLAGPVEELTPLEESADNTLVDSGSG